MKTKLKEIMINKGDKIKYLETIEIKGIEYFTKDKEYESTYKNCLVNNQGIENFVPHSLLHHFFK